MRSISALDYGVLIAYLLGCVGLGSAFARRQKDTRDFFLAGRRMSWLPIALSIVAADLSAISFMGVPAYVFAHNLMLLPGLVTLPLVVPFIIRLFVKTYYRLELFTAYEFLERRFSYGLRAAASLLFILLRLCWLAAALYATAIAVSQITGLRLPVAILILGGTTCAYTAAGGMRAVIWTDVAQFTVFTTAIFAMAGTILKAFQGDIRAIWSLAEAEGRTTLLNLSLSFHDITLWGVLIGYFFINLASYGVDQVILQQYLTAKDIEHSRRSLWANALVGGTIMIPLFFLGLGFFAFYAKQGLAIEPDRVIPHFALAYLPAGLSGLVIAAIFAATMSSVSAGITSITTATLVDFYQRALRPRAPMSHYVRAARLIALLWGAAATLLALFVGRLGTIVEISLKTNSFFTGVLLGIFLLGLRVPRATARGTILGAIIGMATVSFIGGYTTISFLWYSPIGCLTTMLAGWGASVVESRGERLLRSTPATVPALGEGGEPVARQHPQE